MYNSNSGNRSHQGNRPNPEKINFDFYINGKLNVAWLDEKAKDFSEQKIGIWGNEVKYSQIRAFYDEFQTLKAMPFEGEDFNERVIPLLKLLKAKITNRQNRRVLDQKQFFKNFIIELVDTVKDKKTLSNASMIFEAIAGYFPKLKNG